MTLLEKKREYAREYYHKNVDKARARMREQYKKKTKLNAAINRIPVTLETFDPSKSSAFLRGE